MANKHQQDKPENNKEFMNMDKPKFQAQIQVINLNTIKDLSGNISILESCIDLPFEIKRIYYIWNTTKNIPRGNHAHKSLAQGFIAMNGSCELVFSNGHTKQSYFVDDPSKCLIVPPGYWRDILNFSHDCVLLVLASEHYDEQDYIRNYKEFLQYVQSRD